MLKADHDFKVTYLNQWRVGKPLISNRSARAFASVASTLAMVSGGSCALSTSAAASYSGASFLQWPLDIKNFSHVFSQNALDTARVFEPAITKGVQVATGKEYLPPGSVEFDKQVIVFGNCFVEVVVREHEHSVVPRLLGVDHGHEGESRSCKCLESLHHWD